MFTFPLLIRAVGVVPLIVIRNGGDTVALLGRWWARWRWRSSATAVVAWLAAIVISGLVVMMLDRTKPRASSQLVVRTLTDSFERVSDATSHITLLAVVAGLISLAIGPPPGAATSPPTRSSTLERISNSVTFEAPTSRLTAPKCKPTRVLLPGGRVPIKISTARSRTTSWT
jgi:hypothetical protein